MREVLERYTNRAFETGVGIFVIVNGFLTFSPDSAVHANIENVVGYGSIAVPTAEILAGALKLIGIGTNRGNVEAAGLIMVACMFAIRIVMLVSDGEVTLNDVNSITIALCVIACNIIRLRQILKNIQTLQFRGLDK